MMAQMRCSALATRQQRNWLKPIWTRWTLASYKLGKLLPQLLQVGDNAYYAFKYSLAEWLCLVVCIVQIALTDSFLNSSFLTYGSSIVSEINTDPFNRIDPMERTLPIVTMCTLPRYGTAGHKAETKAICVLPNNIVHQKFYLFLWFWLTFLTIVTVIHQIYRLGLLFVPGFRAYITKTLWTGEENIPFFSLAKTVEYFSDVMMPFQ